VLYQEDTYYYLQQSVSLICFKVVDEYYACLSKFRKRKNKSKYQKHQKTGKDRKQKYKKEEAEGYCYCGMCLF